MNFSLFGISFHAYGFIIGMSLMLALWLIEKKAKQIDFKPYTTKYSESIIWWFTLGALLGGIFGARIWHVATDFHLYENSLINSFYIWNGGLSILGGILGGVIGIIIVAMILNNKYSVENKLINNKKNTSQNSSLFKNIKTVLDLVVFGLPFAQATGRFANYINQELYGLPTNLLWGIKIDINNRISGFEEFTKFHPLFLYESILMFMFGIFVWKWESFWKKKEINKWTIGSGKYALLYIWYYSGVRFLLEFMRIDKSMLPWFGGDMIGVNQFVMLMMFLVISVWWIYDVFIKDKYFLIKNNVE